MCACVRVCVCAVGRDVAALTLAAGNTSHIKAKHAGLSTGKATDDELAAQSKAMF